MTRRWQLADGPADAEAVHDLIQASDRHAATTTGTAAPNRDPASTRRLVDQRAVHVYRDDHGRVVATVTLTPTPSFDLGELELPPATAPWYMRRLAVHPETLAQNTFLGVQAVRHVIDTARAGGADALRTEANPELVHVFRMLTALGFSECGRDESGSLRRVYLHKELVRR